MFCLYYLIIITQCNNIIIKYVNVFITFYIILIFFKEELELFLVARF